MNCYDCALARRDRPAVAVCIGCGGAVCLDHSHTETVWLTRTMPINRVVAVEPPAREVRCTTCAAARQAADTGSYRPAQRTARAFQ
jgi:hypothetical protein